VPRLYVRAIDALFRSGDVMGASVVAGEAHRRFAGHPDPATAALACHRAAFFRAVDAPAAGLPLIQEALRLFGQAPPSAGHAEALLDYARFFLAPHQGEHDATRPALDRALEIAEAAGATALVPHILAGLADDAFTRGQVEEGFAFLQRGWAVAQASGDGPALVRLAVTESDVLCRLARFQPAAEVALRGLEAARQAGLGNWYVVTTLAANASEAFLAAGHTAEAAALIDPLTTGPPDRDHWLAHMCRAEIDLLRGDISAAAGRQQLLAAFPARISGLEFARESAQRAAELALWARRPGDSLAEVQVGVARINDPGLTIIFCGRLLGTGMRACADLAEQARARLDQPATLAAMTAADGLVSWVGQRAGAPFTDHRFVATIPAERATWDAERTRLAGESDPAAWGAAAKTWDGLGCPHRAGYAWWRQAQAQLDAGQPVTAATAALRAAAAAAEGHAPLLAQIRALAQRARIPLQARPAADKPAPATTAPYGLTERELAVLRLLGTGRTNAQIGAELYMSPRTAGVHVTSILRKLGVTGRVQAAAVAERAGLLDTQP
jgi:DNA-binding CsgD family transcriptional regulator